MKIAITGATGFVGNAVLRRLLRRGHEVRALVRDPNQGGRLRDLGAVECVAGSLDDQDAVRALVAGTDAVIHLVGIIVEKGPQTFQRVHVEGTERLVAAARAAGVPRFVHMSALGARPDAGATSYHRTKAAGEDAVRGAGLSHVILRPALIAGAGNVPLEMMVRLIRFAPAVPVVGDGRYLLQPVWIEDVAEAFAVAVERADLAGTFEIAGPEQLSWDRMLDELETALSVRRMRVHVPLPMVRLGALAGQFAPELAPITPEQLQMLLEGNFTSANAIATTFGITPRSFAEVARDICAPYAPAPPVQPR
jgi:NADH dehydrogenase